MLFFSKESKVASWTLFIIATLKSISRIFNIFDSMYFVITCQVNEEISLETWQVRPSRFIDP